MLLNIQHHIENKCLVVAQKRLLWMLFGHLPLVIVILIMSALLVVAGRR